MILWMHQIFELLHGLNSPFIQGVIFFSLRIKSSVNNHYKYNLYTQIVNMVKLLYEWKKIFGPLTEF